MTEMTPHLAAQRLQEGNKRFISGVKSVDSLLAHSKMADLAEKGQKPFAIVLTCSDSRSPAEMIFDEGIGELFVVRVAGNVVAPSLIASMEFAVANFHSSILVVLGHTKCGAVDACIKHVQDPVKELPSPHLEELIARIRPAVERSMIQHPIGEGAFLNHAIKENVLRSRSLILEQSRIIREAQERKELIVQPAILDISTGIVQFLS
ncbi:MAG: carbonic anhydrase [Myxococcaceae bacterium]